MNNIIFYSNYCENSKKVLTELIEDLEGRTYLEKEKDSRIWEGV